MLLSVTCCCTISVSFCLVVVVMVDNPVRLYFQERTCIEEVWFACVGNVPHIHTHNIFFSLTFIQHSAILLSYICVSFTFIGVYQLKIHAFTASIFWYFNSLFIAYWFEISQKEILFKGKHFNTSVLSLPEGIYYFFFFLNYWELRIITLLHKKICSMLLFYFKWIYYNRINFLFKELNVSSVVSLSFSWYVSSKSKIPTERRINTLKSQLKSKQLNHLKILNLTRTWRILYLKNISNRFSYTLFANNYYNVLAIKIHCQLIVFRNVTQHTIFQLIYDQRSTQNKKRPA